MLTYVTRVSNIALLKLVYAETEGSQRSAARQKPRPPGRQQRTEYSVPPSQTDGPTPDSAGTAAELCPSPRPRSAQPLRLLHTDETTALRAAASYDSFWLDRVVRDADPFLGRPIPPIQSIQSPIQSIQPQIPLTRPNQPPTPPIHGSDTDIALKPIGSPGVVRQNSAALDRGEKPVPLDGPLVPRSSGPDSPLVEGEGDGTAALAVAVSSCQFSQPEISVLRSGDRNPSELQSRYGRLSHRSLMRMWSEVLWVASVPVLIVTTFFFALTRCVLETVVRPVALGPLQLLGDHLLKPAAVTLHDSLLLPAAALLANALAALALLGRPLGEALDALLRPLATLLASCRLVQVTYGQPAPPGHRLQTV
ncbi:hypothetical protein FJT64_018320 [Amphibalanus amphitrite]|uniref:Uncharacterized protein n=1 Tax=Amphibalanus amphitrite TaxID=1232801 RepID=A0A6A4WY55_AMPAM|nr:hypothetical protein FJT64_018320 [Amphibalanus amphitrite]